MSFFFWGSFGFAEFWLLVNSLKYISNYFLHFFNLSSADFALLVNTRLPYFRISCLRHHPQKKTLFLRSAHFIFAFLAVHTRSDILLWDRSFSRPFFTTPSFTWLCEFGRIIDVNFKPRAIQNDGHKMQYIHFGRFILNYPGIVYPLTSFM